MTALPTILAPQRIVPLSMAWASSRVNCKTYAAEGVVSSGNRSNGAFFDAEGGLTVYRVDEECGALTKRSVERARLPHDAHDTPAYNLDAAGRLDVLSIHLRAERPEAEARVSLAYRQVARLISV